MASCQTTVKSLCKRHREKVIGLVTFATEKLVLNLINNRNKPFMSKKY